MARYGAHGGPGAGAAGGVPGRWGTGRRGTRRRRRLGAALLAAALLGGACAGCGGVPADPAAGPAPAEGRGAPEPPRTAAPDPAVGDRTVRDRDRAAGFTLVASGDVLPHDAVIEQARRDAAATGTPGYDFRPILAAAQPLVGGADVALCHVETVYGAPGGPFSGYPAFRTPPQIADALADTGYDACSTASNHTLDDGPAGVTRTLDAMDAAGLRHVGSARSAAERDRPVLLDAGGAKVAPLSYTYGTNTGFDTRGLPTAAARPWLVNLIDPDRIVADARAARAAGADVVVVSLHWGTEWQEAPDARQLALAERLTASRSGDRPDVDLILGTHAHVPQAYEKVNGVWVVYGMGDQVAGEMQDPRGSMGSTARFTFAPPSEPGAAWRVTRAEFVPHLMARDPRFRLVDLTEVGAGDRPEYVRARALISRAVLSRGAAADGLRMARADAGGAGT